MKTLIGIPCMSMVHTKFMASLLGLRRTGDIHFDIKPCSLVSDARNEISIDAITNHADRVLMIDSDMSFKPDMMERMSARIDEGCDMVCGIFFKRATPTLPVIYKRLDPPSEDAEGKIHANIIPFTDYPMDTLFEVAGCGFGAVMMTTELLKAVWESYKEPAFHQYVWCGEDMTFCYKVRKMGRKIWCDSSIKVGHIGDAEYNEQTWLSQLAEGRNE